MTVEKYLKTALPLSFAGVLFAGYMTGVKWLSGTCAFNETCPTLLGQPACAYGFVIFTAMLVVTVVWMKKEKKNLCAFRQNLMLSSLGILFSGYFAVPEIIVFVRGKSSYMLGLPTCAYGLFFYIAIFVVTIVMMFKYISTQKSGQTTFGKTTEE
ncbi:MAG: hypothetical protein V1738_04435 [Patescibacteria group bacterium]